MAAAWHGVKRVGRALVLPMICRLPTGQLEDPEGGTPHNPPAHPAAAPRSDPCAFPLPAQHCSAADGELAARRGQPESPRQADCSPVRWTRLARLRRAGSQHRVRPQCTRSPVRGRDGPHGAVGWAGT